MVQLTRLVTLTAGIGTLALILAWVGCRRQEATHSFQTSSDASAATLDFTQDSTIDSERSERQGLDAAENATNVAPDASAMDPHTTAELRNHDGNSTNRGIPVDDLQGEALSTRPSITSSKDTSEDQREPVVDPSPESYPFRLLLPTTTGLLLVDLDIRIDDRPLAEAFDERITGVLDAAAGADMVTWNNLLKFLSENPQRFGNSPINPQQYRDLERMYERNRNGKPDPEEVASLIFRDSSFASSFRLVGTNAFRHVNRGQSPMFVAMDRDQDGVLDENEIKQASHSLERLDRNGDRRLDFNEVIDRSISNLDDQAWNNRRVSRWGDVAMDLGGFVDWSMVAYSLEQSTPTAVFHHGPGVVAKLDLDGDSTITADEAKQLLKVDADLRLTLDFDAAFGSIPRIDVKIADAGPDVLIMNHNDGNRVTIRSDRFQLIITASDRFTGGVNLTETFDRLDTNNDGELDESEVPAPLLGQSSFSDLDRDQNGKLNRREIAEGMVTESPAWTAQVRSRGAESPDAVFMWLDQDQNSFLSTRELKQCAKVLEHLAGNQVNLVSDNIPDSYLLQFGRSEPQQEGQLFAWNSLVAAPFPGSRWAESMDTNRDGEIGRAEFLGPASWFDSWDRDRNDFLDAEEIQSMSQPTPR